jgi:hypothetical protein
MIASAMPAAVGSNGSEPPSRTPPRCNDATTALKEATTSELIHQARTGYDHLAGRLGVALARGLERQGIILRRAETYVPGPEAGPRFAELGIDLEPLARARRPLIRGSSTGASASCTWPAR